MERIWILGGTATGKTTVGRYLSEKLNIPFLEMDSVIYKDNKGTRYPEEESEKVLDNFIRNNKFWIIEGIQKRKWIKNYFKKCDLVVILSLPRIVAAKRLLLRYFKRLVRGEQQTRIFLKLKWAVSYEKENLPIHLNLIRRHKKKFILLKNQREIEFFLRLMRKLFN